MLGVYYAGQPYAGQSGIVTTVILSPADATHAHGVDSPSLTQAHTLVVADASQAHTVDSVVLTQKHNLTVSDALHGHTATSPVLIPDYALIVANAAHMHVVDNVTLTVPGLVVADDTIHAHTADGAFVYIIVRGQARGGIISTRPHSNTVNRDPTGDIISRMPAGSAVVSRDPSARVRRVTPVRVNVKP